MSVYLALFLSDLFAITSRKDKISFHYIHSNAHSLFVH